MVTPKSSIKPKHRKRDLVFLVWPDNTYYIQVQEKVPEGVSLDLQAGTWTFQGRSFAIGRRLDYSHIDRVGFPLGCYDRTKLSHLEAFQSAIEWVARRNDPSGD